MEGGREFQISAEDQIYCLFYCFGSCLKSKYRYQIWWQIQMDKSNAGKGASPYQPFKKAYFLAFTVTSLALF